MFHEDILYISYHKYIKTKFFIIICIAKNFIWTTLKVIFSKNVHPQITDLHLGQVSSPNKPYINVNLI